VVQKTVQAYCLALLSGAACYQYTTTTITILRLSGLCSGQPGWASTRRNIHPLTSLVVINHPLSASSIFYTLWHPSCSVYVLDSLFPQSLSKFSLVYLLAWHPPLHTPYISSPNHCLLLAAHAHTIATCFAVVPKLCHLILVSLTPSLGKSCSCNTIHPSDHSHICPLILIIISTSRNETSLRSVSAWMTIALRVVDGCAVRSQPSTCPTSILAAIAANDVELVTVRF